MRADTIITDRSERGRHGCRFGRQVDHDDAADPEGDGLAAAHACTGRLWAPAFAQSRTADTPYPAEESACTSVDG
jgi:hypothetical protein